jgi:F-type H+-transporting ATPase subunit epsilon
MADTFQLQVATPERLFIDEQVEQVELPGKSGYMGILAGHAPLLSALGGGILTYEGGGRSQIVAISGGFVEVFENSVRVLADHAEFPQDIQVDAARRELEEANEAMRRADSEEASQAALDAAQRAQARIDAAEGQHRTGTH